ncbi:MAG: hypothetical protein K0Q72_1067, partial [Armatimonadetes bacterium]|nr:hypothetical protein [Armatimonadota bacterium]
LAARQASISARERQDDAEAVVRRLSALYDREQDLIATRFPEPPPESDFAAKAARLEEARERLGELERCTRELEQAERRPGTPGEPAVPPSAAAPAGWPALLAVALAAVTGWLLREQPVMAALSAGLLLGFAWVWWSHAARETTRVRGARKETEQELVRLRREVETHRTWLDRLCEPYGWTIRETADVREELRLLDAARELRSAYETRLQIAKARQDEWEAACETAEDGEHHLAQLQSAEAAACADWNEWLRQRHLPAGASPETVLSLYHEADRARAAYRERDRHAVQLARLLESQQGYEAEIAVLVREIGWPVSAPEEIPAAVRALPGALESAAAAERERASLLGRARELREEWRSAGMRLRESVAARRVLLGAADVTSEDELRAAAAYQELRDGLLTQIQSGERTLETLSAPGEKRLALEAELMELDQERIELLTATAEAELESAAAELETATREEGRLLERLAALEREELLTARLRELRAKETEVAELAERWAVLRLTQRLLEKTREQFESQRQPGVIRRAGDILKTMTGGRYHRIIAPNGLDQLQLLEAGHAAKPRGWWSRGTAEQLYLALRFAFIEDYAAAPGVEPLPVVMDDVLVHSDGYHRLHRSVEAIAALAQRHQVIYLTCRPADAALLAAADANAQRFRLDAGSFSSL